ncbi:MAG: exodeoxyribonuclease VII large subunit [Deltaproteobacteria bacterium]|nr:exodeoxyribonuclease VII large subunit [Deltaproteobacteria bacterium]
MDKNRENNVFTVSDLTAQISDLLENQFDFVWVEGEVSNFRSPSSGHYYMVLKDENAQIKAVMFRPQARYLKFVPEDGMKAIVQGRISVYKLRGEYQVILDYIEPLGIGALALAFEQLKQRLASQGVFDKEKKRALPYLPQKVAVITSPTGAAIQDFLNVIQRRFANIEITVIPVKVQGDEAPAEIIQALNIVNSESDADVIVLMRGGGSIEDLWAFNSEGLAYAIRDSVIPVVSAVGHEIDVTISDLAADLRAPTPSAAAELLVVEKEFLTRYLCDMRWRLQQGFRAYLNKLRQALFVMSKGLGDPKKRLADSWLRLDEYNNRLIRLIKLAVQDQKKSFMTEVRSLKLHSPANTISNLRKNLSYQENLLTLFVIRRLEDRQMKLSLLKERLNDLNPLSVLKRGYSITRRLPEMEILKGVSRVRAGDSVNIILADGKLDCRVDKIID